MSLLNFWKLDGAGNDFVAFDNRTGSLAEGEAREELVRSITDRATGIGTDGVLVIEPPTRAGEADVRMRYYNRDGSEGEMCGNGARAFALLCARLGAAPWTGQRIETLGGPQRADVVEERPWLAQVRLAMPDLQPPHKYPRITSAGWEGAADFVSVGVPHAVVWVNDLEAIPVEKLGRSLRQHIVFSPSGANVNFAKKAAPGSAWDVEVRTYERGVECETQACGTGSVATALSAVDSNVSGAPVRIKVRSGAILTIEFKPLGNGGATGVVMQGPARVVFQGSALWDPAVGRIVAPAG